MPVSKRPSPKKLASAVAARTSRAKLAAAKPVARKAAAKPAAKKAQAQKAPAKKAPAKKAPAKKPAARKSAFKTYDAKGVSKLGRDVGRWLETDVQKVQAKMPLRRSSSSRTRASPSRTC